MKDQFFEIILRFIFILFFSAISYFAGAFIFISIPKEIIEPFVTNYPILSFFGNLLIGWIISGMLYLSQDIW